MLTNIVQYFCTFFKCIINTKLFVTLSRFASTSMSVDCTPVESPQPSPRVLHPPNPNINLGPSTTIASGASSPTSPATSTSSSASTSTQIVAPAASPSGGAAGASVSVVPHSQAVSNALTSRPSQHLQQKHQAAGSSSESTSGSPARRVNAALQSVSSTPPTSSNSASLTLSTPRSPSPSSQYSPSPGQQSSHSSSLERPLAVVAPPPRVPSPFKTPAGMYCT